MDLNKFGSFRNRKSNPIFIGKSFKLS